MFDKKFFMLLKCVREIYNQRNLYVHALELDEHVGRLTVIKRRQIELLLKDFIDIHEQQQFLTRLDHIANSANESHFLILNEIMIRDKTKSIEKSKC